MIWPVRFTVLIESSVFLEHEPFIQKRFSHKYSPNQSYVVNNIQKCLISFQDTPLEIDGNYIPSNQTIKSETHKKMLSNLSRINYNG